MATDLERLTVSLEANVKKFESELNKARGLAVKTLKDIERESSGIEKGLNAVLSRVGGMAGKVLGGVVAALGLDEVRKAADDYIKIVNSLKTAGVGQGQLNTVFDQLFASAQRNAVPLDALAQLYGRVSQAQTTLKASSSDLLGLTEIVAQSLRVSGTSASEASGALLQLGQSLSGGKVQAEEYNSLLDGMYPLLQAAAAGLKEAGGDVAKLTSLVKDGKVSSEAFFRAIQAGAPLLEEKLAGATLTSEQALTKLNNEFVRAVGEFDKATGASQALASAINVLAVNIGGVGQAAAGAVNGVQALIAKVGELARANAGLQRQAALDYQSERAARTDAAREMALGNAGGRERLAEERAAAISAAAEANRRAVQDFRSSEREYRNALKQTALPPSRPGGVGGGIKPVSLNDFKLPGDDKAGGGGGGADKDRATALERYVISLQKAGELAKADLATAALSNVEREKARALVEATAAAQKDHAAGLRETAELTTAERERILALADATARWKEEARRVKEAMEFTSDTLKDAFKGIVSDLMAGKSAADALASALQRVASKLADKAMDSFLDGLFRSSGGNGLFSWLFGGGGSGGSGFAPPPVRAAGGGRVSGPGTSTSDSIPAMLSNGEYVVRAAATKRNRALLDAINAGKVPRFASGGVVGSLTAMRAPQIPSGLAGRGGGGDVKVNIINRSDAAVRTERRSGGSGIALDVMIDEAVAAKLARPGSSSNRALRTGFGVQPALTRR